MITKNMIEAGREAYRKHLDRFYKDDFVTAIYEAMSDQKQKDAMKDYHGQT